MFNIKKTSLFVLALNFLITSPTKAAQEPAIEAKSYTLIETSSNKVLMSEDAHVKLPPASLTKLMTSYIAQDQIKKGYISMQDMVSISVKAWKQEGSRTFVREGTQVSVSDLLHGVIIQSGNDAAVALAEYIAGSEAEFAKLMNSTALELGMTNTQFKNATGLPADNHYSTAHDLALLADAIIEDHPEFYNIYSKESFEYNGIKQKNRNKLLFTNSDVDGFKTGYTKKAKYGIVASSKKNDMRLISVVLGAQSPESRAVQAQKMLSYGHRKFVKVPVFQTLEALKEVKVWGGTSDNVSVVPESSLNLIIDREHKDKISIATSILKEVDAPIKGGAVAGKIAISVDGKMNKVMTAVFQDSVKKAGFFKVVFDEIKRWFLNMFA